ncbi:hypothetical protein BKA70DRAFT_1565229 [Coprinopsis sp. MPI-PUGE-AT-0042]|nr:hypothetical protein BKA70DRAFT_1565229 [Coprinopsis sp. MPI-PUGE-AT-0042]
MPNNENWPTDLSGDIAPIIGLVRAERDFSSGKGSTGSPARKRRRANSSPPSSPSSRSPPRPALVPLDSQNVLFRLPRSEASSNDEVDGRDEASQFMPLPRPSFANLTLSGGVRRPSNPPTFVRVLPANVRFLSFDDSHLFNPLPYPTCVPATCHSTPAMPQEPCIDPRLLQLSSANPHTPVNHSRQAHEAACDISGPSPPHVNHATASPVVNAGKPTLAVAPTPGGPMAPYRTARPTNQPFGMVNPGVVGRQPLLPIARQASAPTPYQYQSQQVGGRLDVHAAPLIGRAYVSGGQILPHALPPSNTHPMQPAAILQNALEPCQPQFGAINRAHQVQRYQHFLRYSLARAACVQLDTYDGVSRSLALKLWVVGGPRPHPEMLEPLRRDPEADQPARDHGRAPVGGGEAEQEGKGKEREVALENGDGRNSWTKNDGTQEENERFMELYRSFLGAKHSGGVQKLCSLRERFSSDPTLHRYINYASWFFEHLAADIYTRHRGRPRFCEWVVDHYPDGTSKLCNIPVAPQDLAKHGREAGHFPRVQPPESGSSSKENDHVWCRWGGLNRHCRLSSKTTPYGYSEHINTRHLDIEEVVEGRPIVIPSVVIGSVLFEPMSVQVETTSLSTLRGQFLKKLTAICLSYEEPAEAKLDKDPQGLSEEHVDGSSEEEPSVCQCHNTSDGDASGSVASSSEGAVGILEDSRGETDGVEETLEYTDEDADGEEVSLELWGQVDEPTS